MMEHLSGREIRWALVPPPQRRWVRISSIARYRGVLTWIVVVLLGVGANVGAVAQSATTGVLLPINVAVYALDNPSTHPMRVAEYLGYYKKYGLDAKLVELPSNVMMAQLLSDRIDVLCIGATWYSALFQGAELTTVIGIGNILPYALMSQKQFNSVEDLKGKNWSTSIKGASTTYLLLLHVLKSHGMTDSDVNWVLMPSPVQRAQALIAGRIDVTSLSHGEQLQVAGQPNVKVLDPNPSKDFGFRPFLVCVAQTGYAKLHEEELGRFATALIATQRVLNTDPEMYGKALKAILPTFSPADANKLFQLAKDSGYWSVNGGIEPEWIKTSLEIFRSQEKSIKVEPKFSDYFTTIYAKRALDTLGRVQSDSDKASWYK